MINVRNAVNLVIKVDNLRPSTRVNFELLADFTVLDKSHIENVVYISLGDIRQAVILYLAQKDQGEITSRIIEEIESGKGFESAGKLITSSNWGKRKANKKAAAMLCCQLTSGKPCKNAEGCNCGG